MTCGQNRLRGDPLSSALATSVGANGSARNAGGGIESDKTGPLLTPDQCRLLDALIDQGALAIEHNLVEDVGRAKRTIETDRLHSALLTSISHDLKTPLAAVLGAAGTLRDLASALKRPPEHRGNARGRASRGPTN